MRSQARQAAVDVVLDQKMPSKDPKFLAQESEQSLYTTVHPPVVRLDDEL